VNKFSDGSLEEIKMKSYPEEDEQDNWREGEEEE